MVVVNKFSNMAQQRKVSDARNNKALFFKEIVRYHGVPKTNTSDRDVKFLGYFFLKQCKLNNAKVDLVVKLNTVINQ